MLLLTAVVQMRWGSAASRGYVPKISRRILVMYSFNHTEKRRKPR
jgi:hypothetical protein